MARRRLSRFAWLALASCGFVMPAAAGDLQVVTTIKPVHALVAQVMDGLGTPALLVTGTASPHSYSLKPSDAKALNGATVFFRVSEAVEPFTGKIVQSLPASVRVVTLAEAPGIELLQVRTGDTFEAHAHEHEEGGDHDDDDDHGSASRDGHIWLDPRNAKLMVAEIVAVLAAAAPEKAETLQANAAKTLASLDALEAEITRDLAPVKTRPFVVFHDAYQYFERRFGLNAVGAITVSPDVQPSAKRLTEIRHKIGALDAACVFAEPNFSPKLVAAVTEGSKAHSGTLDPEGALVAPGPGAYAALLRNLAAGLKGCLAEGGVNGAGRD